MRKRLTRGPAPARDPAIRRRPGLVPPRPAAPAVEELAPGTYADADRPRFVPVRRFRHWRRVIVGKFSECPQCRALVEGREARLAHTEWHERIEELFGILFGDDYQNEETEYDDREEFA